MKKCFGSKSKAMKMKKVLSISGHHHHSAINLRDSSSITSPQMNSAFGIQHGSGQMSNKNVFSRSTESIYHLERIDGATPLP